MTETINESPISLETPFFNVSPQSYSLESIENDDSLKCDGNKSIETNLDDCENDKPFLCDICDNRFFIKRDLKRHVIHKHSRKNNLECRICSRVFKRYGHLNYHLKTHTNDKQFKCDQCDKDFITKSHLKIHQRVHTGEKLYKCNVCGKQFNQLGNYHAHLRIHSGILFFF